jgi:hypothetical protein
MEKIILWTLATGLAILIIWAMTRFIPDIKKLHKERERDEKETISQKMKDLGKRLPRL